MVTGNPQATGDFVMQALQERHDETSMLRQYKGTLTAIASTLATVAAVIVGMGLDMPGWVVTAAVIIVGSAEAAGIRYYTPEPTKKQQQMVQQTIARKIDAAHGVSEQH